MLKARLPKKGSPGNFAIRHDERTRAFYRRKIAEGKAVVAAKTVAHKLARACFYVMLDPVPLKPKRCFG